MRKRRLSLKELVNLFNTISVGATFEEIQRKFGVDQKYIWNLLYTNVKNLNLDQAVIDKYRSIYKSICLSSGVAKTPIDYTNANKKESKEVCYDATQQESFDNRSLGLSIRDIEGNILNYKFSILVRDKEPFEGELSLTDMQNIYLNYSNTGRNLSARKLLEFFPQYDLNQLKKILRAFQITKDCKPFAPHLAETLSEEELRDRLRDLKLFRVEKRADKDELKDKDNYIVSLCKQLNDLKEDKNYFKDLVSTLDVKTVHQQSLTVVPSGIKSLVLYISDWHIGAYISKRSLFYHPYDMEEIKRRIDRLIEPFVGSAFEEVIIVGLGDLVDGADNSTTRGGHYLPQIQEGNKEMFKWFQESMLYLFDKIYSGLYFKSCRYYSVGESNHGGDFEWMAQKVLEQILLSRYDNIEVEIFESSYGEFKLNNQTFIITHGKDNINMFKNLPLTLDGNPKTELFMARMIDSKGLDFAHIIKGDLHQSATSYGYKCRYKSVGCMIGTTEWSGANFGASDPYCDYDIVDPLGNILEGHTKLN